MRDQPTKFTPPQRRTGVPASPDTINPVKETQAYRGAHQVQGAQWDTSRVEKGNSFRAISLPSYTINQPLFKLEWQLTKKNWDEEIKSYLLQDSRIQLERLVTGIRQRLWEMLVCLIM